MLLTIHPLRYTIEFLLYHDPINDIDSSLKDLINQSNLANLADNYIDFVPKMFTDEHGLDYSSPPIFDEYDDDFLKVESDTENVYNHPFDSKGEKIKESKLLIDELDLPCDFILPSEYDSLSLRIIPGFMLCPQPTMRTRYLTQEFLDFEESCSGFCPSITRSLLPQLYLGNLRSKFY
nr:hypothetical protein [Tanacetum cinerariifolium]